MAFIACNLLMNGVCWGYNPLFQQRYWDNHPCDDFIFTDPLMVDFYGNVGKYTIHGWHGIGKKLKKA